MNTDRRPVVRPGLQRADRVLQATSLVGAVVLLAMLVLGPAHLPPRVPLHFDAGGEPDRWGSPRELVWVPVIALALYALLTVVARVPHLYNYPWSITNENAERQYRLARRLVLGLRAILVWIFVVILWGTARIALGHSAVLEPWFLPVALGAVLVSLVLYFIAAARAS